MKKVFALLALTAMATTAFADPVLVATSYVAPSGNTGWTVSINWQDSATASGYMSLTAEATNIVQTSAFGVVNVNTSPEAAQYDTIDPSYIPANDSYWLVGAGGGFGGNTSWGIAVPPFGGVPAAPNGSPGNNTYRASYGTDPATPVSGITPVLQLVVDNPAAPIRLFGEVARLGVNYNVDVTFNAGGGDPVLEANGGDAGNVRIGTTGSLTATASNVGAAGSTLDGTFPVASPEFGGGGSAFSLADGASQNENYSYTPTDHGTDNQVLSVTSNGGNVDITLSGTGVGPEFADDDADDTIDVGNVFFGATSSASFTISNTGENGLGALTDMTITSVTVIDNDGNVLFSTDLAAGTVIPAGGSQLVTVFGDYGGTPNVPSTGTLIIGTDVGAALGADGADFTFALQGFAVPEPSTVALAVFGALGLAGLVARRRMA